MKNSSLQSDLTLGLGALIALFALAGAVPLVLHGLHWPSLAAPALGVGGGLWLLARIRRRLAPLPRIGAVAREISAGRFDSRFTDISDRDELGRLCWDLNDMLDQLETYFREVGTAIDYNNRGKYFRKTAPTGLHGGFQRSLEGINHALEAQERSTVSQMRNVLMSKVQDLNTRNLLDNLGSTQRDLIQITERMRLV